MPARVVRVQSRAFFVLQNGEETEVAVPKRLRYENPDVVDPVVVGDAVELDETTDPPTIVSVAERKNFLSRPASGRKGRRQILAANIDYAVIVLAARKPRWKPATVDRYLVMASAGGITPLVVLNKIDLNPELKEDPALSAYAFLQEPVLCTSTVTGEGLPRLNEILHRSTSVLIGSSGVGKSSLINAVDPTLELRVGEVSDRTQKGMHTTTWVEMIQLQGGGALIDSPGIRTLDLTGVTPEDLGRHFPEIQDRMGQCRFNDCSHLAEPGCAIQDALETGDIPEHRYESYKRIYRSLQSGSG